MTLLLVDDNDKVRTALRRLLETLGRIEVVGEARNGAEAVQLVAALRPSVVLMDVRMPIMDGIEATRIISQAHPETKVIAFTSGSSIGPLSEMKRAGAAGFILKGTDITELVVGLKMAADGHTVGDWGKLLQ